MSGRIAFIRFPRSAAICVVLAALALCGIDARAAELRATVSEVFPDGRIKLPLPTGHAARPEDAVTISTDVPGIGPVNLQTRWRVETIGADFATAAPAGAVSGLPKTGFSAVIVTASQPQAVARDALDMYRQRAEGGDEDAMVLLGRLYLGRIRLTALPMTLNADEGWRWLRMADARKSADAACEIATIYRDAKDIASVLSVAQWSRQAAEGGSSACMYAYGMMLLKGEGTARNEQQAAAWIKKAADAGSQTARYQLAELYLFGIGFTRDNDKAQALFSELARDSVPGAMFLNCVLLGATKPQEALGWCRKAAETGHLYAMYQIATVYVTGAGIAKNETEARVWYARAAQAGEPESMVSLAFMLDHGVGGPQDVREAARWALGAMRREAASTDAILLRPRDWSTDFWKEVQIRLKQAGVYGGPINGAMSKDTVRAIARFVQEGA